MKMIILICYAMASAALIASNIPLWLKLGGLLAVVYSYLILNRQLRSFYNQYSALSYYEDLKSPGVWKIQKKKPDILSADSPDDLIEVQLLHKVNFLSYYYLLTLVLPNRKKLYLPLLSWNIGRDKFHKLVFILRHNKLHDTTNKT